jgi:hypothetical protein
MTGLTRFGDLEQDSVVLVSSLVGDLRRRGTAAVKRDTATTLVGNLLRMKPFFLLIGDVGGNLWFGGRINLSKKYG